ncbi:MarR family winged helix-turn-helix transcriptional regulator [Paenibacillus sp. GCM10012307]
MDDIEGKEKANTVMEEKMLPEITARYETAMFTVNRKLNAMIRELTPGDLTAEQLSTLRYIRSKGSATSSELADIFCVGRSSITAIITRLSAKNLIIRRLDEKDRRVIYLELSEEGTRLTDEMETRILHLFSKYLVDFDSEEAMLFINVLEKLAKVLAETADGSGNQQ